MRLWSIHPKYLDAKGLVALWRETLLAQDVLLQRTKGYHAHPQLERFKSQTDPVYALCLYLRFIYEEAKERGYNFKKSKIIKWPKLSKQHIAIPRGQVQYEFKHLVKKIKMRDTEKYAQVKDVKRISVHPLFKVVNGDVASWERV